MRLAGVVLLPVLAFGAERQLPGWATEAAARAPKESYPAGVRYVVLLAEEALTIGADGARSMRERGLIRVARPGKGTISAVRSYNTRSGRIRDFRGWLQTPDGKVVEYGKQNVIDRMLDAEALYDEGRMQAMECDPASPPGSIFAYEVTEEEDSALTTYHHFFQGSEPVVVSRLVVTTPPGWELRGVMLNHDPVEPRVEGGTSTWELRGLPWIEDEPYSPGFRALAPRMGVSFFPPGASGGKTPLTPLKDWSAASAWQASLADPAAEAGPAIQAKARDLTASAGNELERIRAIARFVQQTKYVSVQTNVTHGGGYTPHSADSVLAKNYGDCKDKTTLMRALLKAIGIESHAVAIFSGDPHFVNPVWPSPNQFNHMIVAVRVGAGVDLPVVQEAGSLGRLLFFDPTDAYTPLGHLPRHEQGSHAMVIAASGGGLIRMPKPPLTLRRVERVVQGRLTADGRLEAALQSTYHGASGGYWRYMAERADKELRQLLEADFSAKMGGLSLDQIKPSSAPDDPFRLDLSMRVPGYAQVMMDRMLVFRPGALAGAAEYHFPTKERKWPVRLASNLRTDKVVIALPAGFAVDELPEPLSFAWPLGAYRGEWKQTGGEVVFTQTIEVADSLTPARDYAQVREFFARIDGAQAAAVVLVRK